MKTNILLFCYAAFLCTLVTLAASTDSFEVDYESPEMASGSLSDPCLLLIKAIMSPSQVDVNAYSYDSDEKEDLLCLSCQLSKKDSEALGQRFVDIGCKKNAVIGSNKDGVRRRIKDDDMPQLLAHPFNTGRIISGQDYLHAAGAVISSHKMSFPADMYDSSRQMEGFYIEHRSHSNGSNKLRVRHPSSHRDLDETVRKTLVVAGDFLDAKTTLTNDELSNYVYGSSGDAVNLQSQMKACSMGKVNIEAATTSNAGVAIRDGVVRFNVKQNILGTFFVDVYEILYRIAEDTFGDLHQFDHVMFVLPPGLGSWGAIGYFNWHSTAFNDEGIKYVSYQMHEIGHNLNLDHAGIGDNEYADSSGYMGYSYSNNDGPRMCYNGPAYVQLGWFSDREVALTRSSFDWSGNVYGVADYDNTSSPQKMLVYITSALDYQIYVTYNLAVNHNIGTNGGRNKVLVHVKPSGLFDAMVSYLVAELDVGDTYTYSDGTSTIIPIRFKSKGSNFARITIGDTSDPPPSPTPPSPTPPTADMECNQLTTKETCANNKLCAFDLDTRSCFTVCDTLSRSQCSATKQCGWWPKAEKCGFKKCSIRGKKKKCRKMDYCAWSNAGSSCDPICSITSSRSSCLAFPGCKWNNFRSECISQ